MEVNDLAGARRLFDEAVTVAPESEKEEAATAVKQISGIRNIYSMKELAHLSQLRKKDQGMSVESKHSSMNFATLRKKIKHDEDDK